MIADNKARHTAGRPHGECTKEGFEIATEEAALANRHMHLLLYGLIEYLLESALKKPLATLSHAVDYLVQRLGVAV